MLIGNTFSGKELYQDVTGILKPVWGKESEALTKYVLKEILNYDLTDIISTTPKKIEKKILNHLEHIIKRLIKQEPIQYILGYTHFLDRKFIVSPDVLIPRPETEELVVWIRDNNKLGNPSILDIGVGSGCIGISLAMDIGNNLFTGLDYSSSIMKVAELNAKDMGVTMKSMTIDILRNDIPDSGFDIIVSNPPYVLPSEKKHMRRNVLDYEPGNALFVPEDKPLIFYHRIAELASTNLNRNGWLFFEINESFGSEVKKILQEWRFSDIKIKQDIRGKDRFVCGCLLHS
jgi:release factor glutamine methyltransferase